MTSGVLCTGDMGFYRGCMGFGAVTPRIQNQLEKNVEHDMQTNIYSLGGWACQGSGIRVQASAQKLKAGLGLGLKGLGCRV